MFYSWRGFPMNEGKSTIHIAEIPCRSNRKAWSSTFQNQTLSWSKISGWRCSMPTEIRSLIWLSMIRWCGFPKLPTGEKKIQLQIKSIGTEFYLIFYYLFDWQTKNVPIRSHQTVGWIESSLIRHIFPESTCLSSSTSCTFALTPAIQKNKTAIQAIFQLPEITL